MNNLNNLNTLNYFAKQPTDSIYYAGTGASLDLNFAGNKSLIDRISGNNLVTFTRASSGTFVDGSGVLQTASTDIPRFDHNLVTGKSLGLLVEEQRTNEVRNNTMVGAVTGTPGTLPTNWGFTGAGLGTLSSSVVATGISNGIDYIDIRIFGTTSTTSLNIRFENPANVTTVLNENWTNSTYVAMIGGSTSNLTGIGVGLMERTSVGAFLISSTTFILSLINSTLTRYNHTRTASQATVAQIEPNIQFSFNSGVAIDVTLRIGLPQIEKALFATSVIKTTGSVATRNADVADITGTNFSNWYNSTEGTLYSEYRNQAIGDSAILEANDNTANERINIRVNSTDPRFFVNDGGSEQANLNGGTVVANTSYKSAGAYKVNDFAFCNIGGTVQTDTSGTIPTVNRLFIGRNQPGAYFNGHIARIVYFNTRISNTNLQRITL
jgi:hypothetical protein